MTVDLSNHREQKIVNFIDQSDIGVEPKSFKFIFEAYNEIKNLSTLQGKGSVLRLFQRMIDVIYPPFYAHLKEHAEIDEVLKSFKKYDKNSYIQKSFANNISNEEVIKNSMADRYRNGFKRNHEALEKLLLKLSETEITNKESNLLDKAMDFFGEIYYLLSYCIKKEEFFEAIDLSKKEKFIQYFLTIGDNFIYKFTTNREDKKKMTTDIQKYRFVTDYDLLNGLQESVAYHVADVLDVEDFEEYMEQRYVVAEKPLQTVTFKSEDGLYVGKVFVRSINEIFYVLTVEELEGQAPNVYMEEIHGVESFKQFFVELINNYDLLYEYELSLEEMEQLKQITDKEEQQKLKQMKRVSTIEEILIALELLTD